jgi:hypothetical protein
MAPIARVAGVCGSAEKADVLMADRAVTQSDLMAFIIGQPPIYQEEVRAKM